METRRFTKWVLGLVVIVSLGGARWFEGRLDAQRQAMGLSETAAVPQGAPPMLAFTTMALGGFRGLIANVLWIRANQMQQEEKFFEMVQLSKWITDLEPHLNQVWSHVAWNLAFNISVKFSDHEDRYKWVQRGIATLRDEGLRYNPDQWELYRELGWLFFFKMGQNLDDAHMLYKQRWMEEMVAVLGPNRDSYRDLLEPKTDEARARLKVLREKYKMDPQRMVKTDEAYGPLEWRLPEAHAIYWTMIGMEKCRGKNYSILRTLLYQPLKLAFDRGRVVANRAGQPPLLAPNLDLVPRVNASYEQMMVEDPDKKDRYRTAQRNFLREAVFFLYTHHRLAEATQWYNYLRSKFPEDDLARECGDAETMALKYVTAGVKELDRNQAIVLISGFVRTGCIYLAMDYDDNGQGTLVLARKLYASYQSRVAPDAAARIGLPEYKDIQDDILRALFDPQKGLAPELQAVLRTKLETLGVTVPAPIPAPAAKKEGAQ